MGEDSTDNLQEREDELAERYAAEDGGTGLSYYDDDNYGYNYQDSNPLTDIDYQQPNDESSAFTGGYTGEDDYDPVNREDDEESDDEDFDGDDEDFDGDGGNFDGNDEEYEDNDNVENEDEDSDTEREDKDGTDDEESGENKKDDGDVEKDESAKQKGKGAEGKEQDADDGERALAAFEKKIGIRLWREGNPVTVDVLLTHWDLFRQNLPYMRPMMDEADLWIQASLMEKTKGPNLVLELNEWIAKLGDQSQGMISSLLNLISRFGLRLTYGSIAAFAGIFFTPLQEEARMIFTLKTSLTEVLYEKNVQKFMSELFSRAMKQIKAKLKGGK